MSGKSEFVYGEIDFIHIIPVFELVNPQSNEVFCDLGCGASKCMASMSLVYPELKSVNGVEFLQICTTSASALLSDNQSGMHAPTNPLLGDLLEVDWSDTDIILASSICFPEELIECILERTR